MTNLRS